MNFFQHVHIPFIEFKNLVFLTEDYAVFGEF